MGREGYSFSSRLTHRIGSCLVVQQVMRQLGKDSYPLRRLFMLFDTNRNGFIDSEELIQGFQKLHPQGEAAVQCE